MKAFARLLVVFVGAMLLQWWWNTHFAYWGAAPQFLLAGTVVIAARRGPIAGMLAGFVWGLFVDVSRAELFGASALVYVLAAYLVGAVRRQIDLRAAGPLAVVALILTWTSFLLHGLLGLVFSRGFELPGWIALFATPFLNAVAAVIGTLAWEVSESR